MNATGTLKLSTSRKVAAWAHPLKGAKVKNCFSLPAGKAASCPGATSLCDPAEGGYCYAGRDERRFPSVRNLVENNLTVLRSAASVADMADMLNSVLSEFRRVSERKGLPLVFRIHEDGDFFSKDYAAAWALVCAMNPDITFWAYTRSFGGKLNVVPVLWDVPNLNLYVSVDPMNQHLATDKRRADWKAHGVNVAIVEPSDTAQETAVRLLARKAPVCPEIAGKVPLVNDEGVGACVTCGLCIHGRAPVIFPIHR